MKRVRKLDDVTLTEWLRRDGGGRFTKARRSRVRSILASTLVRLLLFHESADEKIYTNHFKFAVSPVPHFIKRNEFGRHDMSAHVLSLTLACLILSKISSLAWG